MGLSKHSIGEFVELYSSRCGIANLSPEQVSGINIEKEFLNLPDKWVKIQATIKLSLLTILPVILCTLAEIKFYPLH